MSIIGKLNRRADAANSLLCIGLDTVIERIPPPFQKSATPQFEFNRYIIEATHPYTAAYKPNIAFYEARGRQGLHELALTIEYLRREHPDIFTICDAKRGDIGSTSEAYASAIFDELGFDSVTLQPYLGQEALSPFLQREDKGCIILCRTSNPGAGEFQDLLVEGVPLWQMVAQHVSEMWNRRGNCMLVMGATYPDEMQRVRKVVGDMPFLVPGIGAQGGNVRQTVEAGMNRQRKGLLINSSRGIIFAEDPAEAARNLRDEINQYR